MVKDIIDIKIRCYKFSVEIIKYLNTLDIKKINYPLIDQLFRSSTSIGANIVEAKSGSSKKDFINYYQIALKSSNETKYWFCLLRDALEFDKIKINSFLEELK